MSVRGDVELLRRVPLFAHVESAQLQLLVFSARRLDVPAGELLVKKGKSEDAGFLVLAGEGEAFGRGREALAGIGVGAFIGELQMIARLPSSISVRATNDMHVLAIGHELFTRVLSEFPDAAAKMLGVLSRKLDASVKDLKVVQRYFDSGRRSE